MGRNNGGFGYSRQVERARLLLIFGAVLIVLVGGIGIVAFSVERAPESLPESRVTVQKELPKVSQIEVLIPRQTIKAGTLFELAQFDYQKRLDVNSTGMIRDIANIQGKYAKIDVPAGQPLLLDQVTAIRPTNGVSPNIPPGFRAVTVSVNATSSVAGWALPGARVDVLWSTQLNSKSAIAVIVQNAKILSAERIVDPNAQTDAPMPSTITLLVTSDDAQKIHLAQTTGTINLSLRGDSDSGAGVSMNPLDLGDLIGNDSGTKKAAPAVSVKLRRPDGTFEEKVLEGGRLVAIN